MPVYNEEEIIGNVLEKWANELTRLGIDYQIHAYDGSKDHSLAEIKKAAGKNNRIIAHAGFNKGHGRAVLHGYRENSDAQWIFQIDSDDEMGTEAFEKIWNSRDEYDFLIGRRSNRQSPLPRRIISLVSRLTVRIFYGTGVYDVNSPYRLMRGAIFKEWFYKLPDDLFAPNVVISGICGLKKYKIFETDVNHIPRATGEVSIKKLKLLKVALLSFRQTIKFRFEL